MKAHLLYLKYIVRHKWFVFQAGLKTGAPIWRLIIHDWSKFLPCEWTPYVRYFYGPKPDMMIVDEVEYWSQVNERQAPFDAAWLHHQHANPHHWQHWILREDSGAVKVIEMPERFVREMVADWAGAGRAINGKWEVVAWYIKNEEKIMLGPRTKERVRELLNERLFGETKEAIWAAVDAK